MPAPLNFLMQSIKRLRNPALAWKADELVNDSLPYLSSVPDAFEDSSKFASTHQWLKSSAQEVGNYWDRLKREFHSPDMVIGHEPGGKTILDAGTTAQLEKGKFLDPVLHNYSQARGGIKQGTDASQKVFDALEAPGLVGQLGPEEKKLHDYLKGTYDYTHKMYSLHLVEGNQQAYNKVLRLSLRNADDAEILSLSEPEKKAYDFMKRKIGDYAPHFFDREQLLDMFQTKLQEKLMKAQGTKVPDKIAQYMDEAKDYEASIQRLQGGDPLSWEGLPKEFVFRHEMVRRGEKGYTRDAIKSFNNYIFSLARKMYDEPAVQNMRLGYDQLPFELRPYARWFIRDFAGYNQRNVWDDLAGQVAGFEYMRTLGLNLRSPIVNLTQQFNTVVDAGLRDSWKGWMKTFTREGEEMWRKSGLPIEVPMSFTEELSPYATKMDQLKRVLGYFFNKAENFNRKHAFLTYMAKNEGDPDALKKAIDGVHKTQFLYGKLGMPKALRHPAGRVGLQFSSFSIKQAEFLYKLAKESPTKLLTWVGGTMGGNYTLQELLGVDLSNALGFGVNVGEAIQMVRDAGKGEFDEAWEHAKLSVASGGGILPSGPGPAVSGLLNIAKGIKEGTGLEALKEELTPVQAQRITSLVRSYQNKNLSGQGKLPILAKPSIFGEPFREVVGQQPAWKSMVEAFGPQLTERTKKRFEDLKAGRMEILDSRRKHEIARLMVEGNVSKASELIKRWNIVPSTDAIREEALRKRLPREQRTRFIRRMQRMAVREEQE